MSHITILSVVISYNIARAITSGWIQQECLNSLLNCLSRNNNKNLRVKMLD